MEREYYIVEVEGEGCYCLCYDDVNGKRVVIDWDLEIREDWLIRFALNWDCCYYIIYNIKNKGLL